jgi:dihydrofolate synthase / folylpolyglutamate synthase
LNRQNDLLKRLKSSERFGIKLGLDQIRILLKELGEPQESYPSILVAGTNGKGSVSAMMESVLSAHGFQTGLYTSPHLVDVRERIRVNKRIVPPEEFEHCLTVVFAAIDRLMENSRLQNIPTYFEILTAAAFYYFRERQVDFAVVEVGLGGRFDATNVLHQKLSIITTIDFDHEEHLGRSLAEISFEKAGILKPEIPVVTGILPEEAGRVVHSSSIEKNCTVYNLVPQAIRDLHLEDGFPVFNYQPWEQQVRIGLRGRHQAHNGAVAMLAAEVLQKENGHLKPDKIIDALSSVLWRARLEFLSYNPVILLDCAHNPMGVSTLVSFLKDMNWSRVVALFTAMKDKNISLMLQQISDPIDTMFLTRVAPQDRCASAEELMKAATGAGIRYAVEEDPETAIIQAKKIASEKEIPLIIFGSIYLIGRILKISDSNSL